METDRTPEQILELLITAAGNADVVRLAAIVADADAAGVTSFTRPVLTDLWSQRWRHHVAMPGGRKPEQRVNRALPNLIAVTAVTNIDGPQMRVDDPDLLGFLAERVYLAEAQDVQHPMSNTLPVGDVTRAAAEALVMGMAGS